MKESQLHPERYLDGREIRLGPACRAGKFTQCSIEFEALKNNSLRLEGGMHEKVLENISKQYFLFY